MDSGREKTPSEERGTLFEKWVKDLILTVKIKYLESSFKELKHFSNIALIKCLINSISVLFCFFAFDFWTTSHDASKGSIRTIWKGRGLTPDQLHAR